MRYVRITERVQAPQFLQVQVQGQTYDIVLHEGARRRLKDRRDAGPDGQVRRHPAYFVWLYTAGKGALRLQGTCQRFRSGTLMVTQPNEPYNVVHECAPVTAIIGFGFAMITPDRAPLLMPMHELLSLWSGETLPKIDFPIQLSATLARQLERLLDTYLSMLIPRGMIHCFPAHKAALDILCFLIEHVYARATPCEPLGDSRLMRVRIEIERRYDEELTLQQLADMAFLSPEYLCRAFRKAFGASPLAYQQELRLRAAKALLSTTGLRISEIADTVGYQSVPHFCRLFRKRLGCTPTAYSARSKPRVQAAPGGHTPRAPRT